MNGVLRLTQVRGNQGALPEDSIRQTPQELMIRRQTGPMQADFSRDRNSFVVNPRMVVLVSSSTAVARPHFRMRASMTGSGPFTPLGDEYSGAATSIGAPRHHGTDEGGTGSPRRQALLQLMPQ